jgi:hypothetical protein
VLAEIANLLIAKLGLEDRNYDARDMFDFKFRLVMEVPEIRRLERQADHSSGLFYGKSLYDEIKRDMFNAKLRLVRH